MEQRNIGSSGIKVSAVGLGCNNFGWTMDEAASVPVIHKALDLGVTLFDTAPVYGETRGASEEIIGRALGARRKDVAIVTKFGVPANVAQTGRMDTSRAAVLAEAEASLQRLGTDYIDIYMLHWPDWSTPIEETLRALEDLITAGKVRALGCSNIPAWRLVEAQWTAKASGLHDFIVSQNEYSLAQREVDDSLMPALETYGVGLMPYAPLANGLLTGKFSAEAPPPEDSRLAKNTWGVGSRYLSPSRLNLADMLADFAASKGHNLIELAHGWLLSKPIVSSVIGGATKVQQVEANVAAGNAWRLSVEEMAEVDAICKAARKAKAA